MGSGYNDNDLQTIITQAIEEMKFEKGKAFDINNINLAELGRKTGISRGKLRRLKKAGFIDQPHGLVGRKSITTVISGYEITINGFLQKGVSNSVVIFDHIKELGYTGSLTSVKMYILAHKDLLPAKRSRVDPQGNRGRRYCTEPGESYQMDWGFVNVYNSGGTEYHITCFAMICHHCGERYIEFFPNARQENLFIGMLHGFAYMGVPRTVLTDNMKSVVTGRDTNGRPFWQTEYEMFMKTVGFSTKLCKVRHPFTKGKVERLIRFVKENFLAGRVFNELTDLNYEALNWCDKQNTVYHRCTDCIPAEKHRDACLTVAQPLPRTKEVLFYLCPRRLISFDGFVNYEGRRFGVPFTYKKRVCRVSRQGYILIIYDDELKVKLVEHNVTWSKRDSYCKDQYVNVQPEEFPTTIITTAIKQKTLSGSSPFDKFDFEKEVNWDE